MEENTIHAEAERLLGIAEKLLQSRDFNGSRDFAVLAQETEPLLEGSDQILAIAEVLLAADKRINNHHDWYSILQLERRSGDIDLIKKQYRRLALLLHPDKNKFPFSDHAFKLVADAWAVLNDQAKKPVYDNELSLFTKIDLGVAPKTGSKLPVNRSSSRKQQQQPQPQQPQPQQQQPQQQQPQPQPQQQQQQQQQGGSRSENRLGSFWTACPYCYVLFEYPRVYEGCCMRCQNCNRAFHGAVVPSLPPLVPGKEAYYCCWGFFPMGFELGGGGKGVAKPPAVGGFPNWMPPMFSGGQQDGNINGGAPAVPREAAPPPPPTPPPPPPPPQPEVVVEVSNGSVAPVAPTGSVPKKRGRPRKNP